MHKYRFCGVVVFTSGGQLTVTCREDEKEKIRQEQQENGEVCAIAH